MSSRRAFTFMELLVVIAIIAIIAGLFLPATRRVQKASERMRCLNNLKQIGLAFHSYHDTHKSFPPGTLPNADLPPDQRLAFTVSLLPFLEEDKLHTSFDLSAAWDAPHNAKATETAVVTQYRCLGVPAFGADLAKIHYVAVAGVGSDAATLPLTSPLAGMVGLDRKPTLADVKDGTANTMLVIETGRDLGHWARGGFTTVRGIDPSGEPLVGVGRAFGGNHVSDKSIWRKQQPLGANVLMADASTRTLSESVSTDVLKHLATVAGGESLPPDW